MPEWADKLQYALGTDGTTEPDASAYKDIDDTAAAKKVTLFNRNKKHIPKSHGAKFRYKSSDTGIATVSKKGKIKGIKKGKCTIYVYSINGLMKKAKVT